MAGVCIARVSRARGGRARSVGGGVQFGKPSGVRPELCRALAVDAHGAYDGGAASRPVAEGVSVYEQGEQQVTDDHHGARLDKALAVIAACSRGEARRRIEAGAVFVDGQRCRVQSALVQAGQRLQWSAPPPDAAVPVAAGPRAAEAESAALAIIDEDPWLLVVAKPAGLQTAPGRAGGDSLLAHVQAHLRAAGGPRVGEVHRLDRETSGLLVFGKDVETVASLGRSLQRRQIGRGYLALVRSPAPPPAQRIAAPLRQVQGGDVRVHPCGAAAATRVLPLAWSPRSGLAWVALALESGRTHQARVHLAWAVGPVLGDSRYGDVPGSAALPSGTIGLHCARLGLRHPRDGSPRHWLCPPPPALVAGAQELGAPPDDWQELLRDLGRGTFDASAWQARRPCDIVEAPAVKASEVS